MCTQVVLWMTNRDEKTLWDLRARKSTGLGCGSCSEWLSYILTLTEGFINNVNTIANGNTAMFCYAFI